MVSTVVKLSGDIDILRAAELRSLAKSLSPQDSVVFDLTEADFIDTTFLRFLVNVKRQENKSERSAIKIVGMSNRVRRIFEVTGLTTLFEM